MGERALPAGLAIAELFAEPPCQWFVLSKAKHGPDLRYGCSFCGAVTKTQACRASLQQQGEER